MANTSFKIVDYLATNPTNQYDFTFPDGWTPLNEAQMPSLNIERDSYPYVNLSYLIDYGFKEKVVVLQGRDVEDNDRYELSACIADSRIKKLYLGDDWFYYVRGLEGRSTRDAEFPLTYNYTASFLCVDPCMYYDGTTTDDYPAGTVGFGYLPVASNAFTMDLRQTEFSNSGSWFVEPIIWVDDENGDTGTIEDDKGRKLSFTPGTANVWVIMPYFNPYADKFFPDHPIAYEYQTDVTGGSNKLEDYDEFYAMDFKVEGTSPDFERTTGNYSLGITLSDQNSSMKEKYNNKYPRAEWNTQTTFVVTGWADANVKIQWRYRRV